MLLFHLLQSVPVEQFFETDYHPLLRDLNHWVLDEATQVLLSGASSCLFTPL